METLSIESTLVNDGHALAYRVSSNNPSLSPHEASASCRPGESCVGEAAVGRWFLANASRLGVSFDWPQLWPATVPASAHAAVGPNDL